VRQAVLVVWLFSVSSSAQVSELFGRDPGARCRRPCRALLTDARLAASLCAKCGLDADPMSFLFKLPAVPAEARADDDWQVRWGAVRAEAKLMGLSPEKRLAQWVDSARGSERVTACITALFAAGARPTTRDAFLAASPAALAACQQVERSVSSRAEDELLVADLPRALEALACISRARGVGAGRVVLDAVQSRPTQVDEPLATLLVHHAERGGPAAGLTLLRDATPRDQGPLDRLLVVYAAVRDRQRPLLGSTEREARRQALVALAPLAPLSASELALGLDDPQASLRMLSANALARGEGLTVVEAAEARLSGSTPASPAEKRRWLTLLADVDDASCPPLTRRTWKDQTQPDVVRAEALVSLAGCARRDSLPDLIEASTSSNVTLQAAVMRAVLQLPREPRVTPLIEAGLSSPTEEVIAGAAQALGAHRLTPLAPRLVPLLDHGSALVRAQALTALFVLDPRRAQPLLISRLEKDPDAKVRVAASAALSEAGGPLAISALARASKHDPDERVKMAAVGALRRLGVTP